MPPTLVAINAARFAPNVPYKDQWGMIPFVAEAVQGRLNRALLWQQVNEHRIPLPRLVVAALAWASRWDVRYEVAADFVLALVAALVLVAVVRRTVRPHAPAVAPWLVPVVSQLTFSLTQGYNWTWGTLMAMDMATLAVAGTAWTLARWDGGWRGVVTMEAWAMTGALSFGSGLALLWLVGIAILLAPTGAALPRRLAQAAVAIAVAGAFGKVYFVGWYPRLGEPPPVFAWATVPQYTTFVLAYLGGAIGVRDVAVAARWGMAGLVVLAVAAGWLWVTSPRHRAAMLPWLLIEAYGLATAGLTAFGRLQNGLHVALLARYRPAVAMFAIGVVVVAALAAAHLTTRSGRAGGAAALTLIAGLALAAPDHYRGSLDGVSAMRNLDRMLRAGGNCLQSCATATPQCLLLMCWDAGVARRMCPLMERFHFGLFAPPR